MFACAHIGQVASQVLSLRRADPRLATCELELRNMSFTDSLFAYAKEATVAVSTRLAAEFAKVGDKVQFDVPLPHAILTCAVMLAGVLLFALGPKLLKLTVFSAGFAGGYLLAGRTLSSAIVAHIDQLAPLGDQKWLAGVGVAALFGMCGGYYLHFMFRNMLNKFANYGSVLCALLLVESARGPLSLDQLLSPGFAYQQPQLNAQTAPFFTMILVVRHRQCDFS